MCVKKKILVFPCGSEVGLTIHDSVKWSTHFELIGVSSMADHGEYVYEKYIKIDHSIEDSDFIDDLIGIVKERQIDAVYPTIDSVIAKLSDYEDQIGCRIIGSCRETAILCHSKKSTYLELRDSIRTPHIYDSVSLNDFPIFTKPDDGHSSLGTSIIKNVREYDEWRDRKPLNIFLEYLPGDEYTIDCFTDRYGTLRYCRARKRERIKNGISVATFYEDDMSEFYKFANAVNRKISFRGAWFIQVKRDNEGCLCLLEIASRIAGSSSLSLPLGINLPLLSLYDAFDIDVEIIANDFSIKMDRSLNRIYKCVFEYNYIYIDYDDCLITDHQTVNSDIIKFLYDAINNGKKIILLTKHKGDITRDLFQYRCQNLFDEIIHIDERDEKSRYINHMDSIFIDDSFAERKRIKDRLNIPVFSPEMIFGI